MTYHTKTSKLGLSRVRHEGAQPALLSTSGYGKMTWSTQEMTSEFVVKKLGEERREKGRKITIFLREIINNRLFSWAIFHSELLVIPRV